MKSEAGKAVTTRTRANDITNTTAFYAGACNTNPVNNQSGPFITVKPYNHGLSTGR